MLCGEMIRNAVCFKTAKIIKTNANIIGEPRKTNDEGVVVYLKRKQLNMFKYTYVSSLTYIFKVKHCRGSIANTKMIAYLAMRT